MSSNGLDAPQCYQLTLIGYFTSLASKSFLILCFELIQHKFDLDEKVPIIKNKTYKQGEYMLFVFWLPIFAATKSIRINSYLDFIKLKTLFQCYFNMGQEKEDFLNQKKVRGEATKFRESVKNVNNWTSIDLNKNTGFYKMLFNNSLESYSVCKASQNALYHKAEYPGAQGCHKSL
ncbi:hypothetical protein NQ317_008836, partial [Molorchus minor]